MNPNANSFMRGARWLAIYILVADAGGVVGATPAPAQSAGTSSYSDAILYSFNGGSDGRYPSAGPIFDSSGALYGVTTQGGKNSSSCSPYAGCGVVFKLTPPAAGQTQWTETVLYAFLGGNDGYMPNGGLIFDTGGALYGTTQSGGAANYGTAFQLIGGVESVIHTFQGGNDGALPLAGMIFDTSGALYGVTASGGPSNAGTVFKLTPSSSGWNETVLYAFTGGKDGGSPSARLIFDTSGALYGTTRVGGTRGAGAVFKLTPSNSGWNETVLYSFYQNVDDGWSPDSELIFDTSGALYGSTSSGGGRANGGTVFKLTPPVGGQTQWTETVIHSFNGKNGDSQPAGVIFDSSGSLYGATGYGTTAKGTVFKLTPPVAGQTRWIETVLYNFKGGSSDGQTPAPGLVFGAHGALYGATFIGGAFGYGALFKLQCASLPPHEIFSGKERLDCLNH
jgi:uncharacterized repeat protein (TIGR03803 family)